MFAINQRLSIILNYRENGLSRHVNSCMYSLQLWKRVTPSEEFKMNQMNTVPLISLERSSVNRHKKRKR